MSRVVPPFDVICVGAVNVDTIVPVDRVPGDDERVLSTGFITAGGGPAATAAVALARLGARVAFCGVVGDDPEGEVARSMLEAENVDTRFVRVDARVSTARAVILTSRSTSGRSIVTMTAPMPSPEDVPVGESAWLHVDQTGFDAARVALAGDRTGTRFSVDAGNPIASLSLVGVDLYVPTVGMLLARYGSSALVDALEAAKREGAREVVATAGAEGSYVLTPEGVVKVPTLKVHPVSTLGAGDVFHGALLARLVAGEPLVDAVSAASIAAAVSCRAIDGRSGIPTGEELTRLRTTPLSA